jgi:hypothetical protein
VGDAWVEATPTFTQKTATLKILGGDADVDNFIQATYADPNDVEAEVQACTPRPSGTSRVGGEGRLAASIKCTTNNGPQRRSAKARSRTCWDQP